MVATFSEHHTFHPKHGQTSHTCLGLGASERHPACQQPGVQAEDSGPGVLDREGGGVPRHPAQILPVKGRRGQGKLPQSKNTNPFPSTLKTALIIAVQKMLSS